LWRTDRSYHPELEEIGIVLPRGLGHTILPVCFGGYKMGLELLKVLPGLDDRALRRRPTPISAHLLFSTRIIYSCATGKAAEGLPEVG
jgi:hypothetical protein